MAAVQTAGSQRFAGWSAYISAALSIIGAVALALFYALEAPRMIATGDTSGHIFGPLSDYAAMFQFLFMLPLALALHQRTPERNLRLSRVAEFIGTAGLLTAALAQFLLVAHIIDVSVNLPIVLVGMALIGVWLVLANGLGRLGGTLSSQLARLGEFSGAMFALSGGLTLLFVLANAIEPAAIANLGTILLNTPVLIGAIVVVLAPALLAYVVGMPVWLIGLGRHFLAE